MYCRCCHHRLADRPFRLCRTCYANSRARIRFLALNKFARRGIADYYGPCDAPALPTEALPGTEEKVTVLAERAKLGQELWHPRDASRGTPDKPALQVEVGRSA